ncbi:succinylglutamate desuccinylase/aspartoacylase family protein [Haliea sp.]
MEHSDVGLGIVQIPVSVLTNGSGPTVLLMGGVHGDEYEGQVALTRLLANIELQQLQGRLIVMPAVNLPAVLAGTRSSPLDGGNLNRSFSPTAADSPTVRIARYLSDVIFPLCDYCFDCHTAGSCADHYPAAYASLTGNREKDLEALDTLEYINSPLSWGQPVMHGPFSEWVMVEHGVRYFGSEFGGCSHLQPKMLWHAERAIYRLLDHARVLPLDECWSGKLDTRWVIGSQSGMVYAPSDGVLLAMHESGTDVRAGELAGLIYRPEIPTQTPVELRYPVDGILAANATTGRVKRGDLTHLLMHELSKEALLESAST